LAARATFWLGHSAALHSHAKTPPHFASLGLCYAKPLSGLAKRRKQPERYATFFENLLHNFTKHIIIKNVNKCWKINNQYMV
jgi:hypothetical protein